MSTLAGYEALRLCHSNWYFLRIYAFSICFQLICLFFNQLPLFSTHWYRFPSVPCFQRIQVLSFYQVLTFLYGSSFFCTFTRFSTCFMCYLRICTFLSQLHVFSPNLHLIHMFSSHFRLFSVFESFCNIFCSLYVTQLVIVISGISFRSRLR